MKKITTLAVMLIVSISAMAQAISQEQAIAKAQQFLTSSKGMHKAKGTATNLKLIRQQEILANTIGDQMYLYNVGDGNGFVIVSGDERTPAILGYADTGSINPQNMPENMRAWMQGYADDIRLMQTSNIITPVCTATHSTVSPLVQCEWNQDAPYNNSCPVISSTSTATGCVATAMAQILYTVRPSGCKALSAYSTETNHIPIDAKPSTTFNWSSMRTHYDKGDNDNSAKEVAKLMAYCGHSVEMDYNVSSKGGSGAATIDAANSLKEFFGISNSISYVYRSDLNSETWDNVIYNELANSRPVLFSGRNASSGHAFVCDGYDGAGKYHINWGWGGLSNGYFYINKLSPDAQGIGGSNDGYNNEVFAVIGIKKAAADEEYAASVYCKKLISFGATSTRTSKNTNFTIEIEGLYHNMNKAYSLKNYYIAWGVYDTNGNLLQVSTTTKVFNHEYRYGEMFNFGWMVGNGLGDGTYQLRPISHQEGATSWAPCDNYVPNTLTMKISGNTATITALPKPGTSSAYKVEDVNITGTNIANAPQTLTFKVTNTGDTYTGCIALLVDGYIHRKFGVSIDPEQSDVLTGIIKFSSAGTHSLSLILTDDENHNLGTLYTTSYSVIAETFCTLSITTTMPGCQKNSSDVYITANQKPTLHLSLNNSNNTAYNTRLVVFITEGSSSEYTTEDIFVKVPANSSVEYDWTLNTMLNPSSVYALEVGYHTSSGGSFTVSRNSSVDVIYDPTATGITTPVSPSQSAQGIYTLDGRRVNASAPLHGIYIKDGKKYVVK